MFSNVSDGGFVPVSSGLLIPLTSVLTQLKEVLGRELICSYSKRSPLQIPVSVNELVNSGNGFTVTVAVPVCGNSQPARRAL